MAVSNATPTEQNRSIPVSTVQAFDLKGNPLDATEWTKRLANPQHVLLLREPIKDSNKLNPFYTAILRDDTLLLFLKGQPVDIRKVSGTAKASFVSRALFVSGTTQAFR